MLRCRFADNAHGYVGADLMAVVKESSMISLRNFKNFHAPNENDEFTSKDHFTISINDVKEAFQHIRPSGLREVAIDVPKVSFNLTTFTPVNTRQYSNTQHTCLELISYRIIDKIKLATSILC